MSDITPTTNSSEAAANSHPSANSAPEGENSAMAPPPAIVSSNQGGRAVNVVEEPVAVNDAAGPNQRINNNADRAPGQVKRSKHAVRAMQRRSVMMETLHRVYNDGRRMRTALQIGLRTRSSSVGATLKTVPVPFEQRRVEDRSELKRAWIDQARVARSAAFRQAHDRVHLTAQLARGATRQDRLAHFEARQYAIREDQWVDEFFATANLNERFFVWEDRLDLVQYQPPQPVPQQPEPIPQPDVEMEEGEVLVEPQEAEEPELIPPPDFDPEPEAVPEEEEAEAQPEVEPLLEPEVQVPQPEAQPEAEAVPPQQPQPSRRLRKRRNDDEAEPEVPQRRRRTEDAAEEDDAEEDEDPNFVENIIGHDLPDAPPTINNMREVIVGQKLAAANQKQVVDQGRFKAVLNDNGIVSYQGSMDGASLPPSFQKAGLPGQWALVYNDPSDPITQIAAGENHLVMLSRKGFIFTFGRSKEGQLGATRRLDRYRLNRETAINMRRTVNKVVTVNGKKKLTHVIFKKVIAGGNTTKAVADDGTVYVCGNGIELLTPVVGRRRSV